MKNVCVLALMILISAPIAMGDDAPSTTTKLGERLIYSVDRVPEDTFDAPRAVTVIGRDELLRRNGMTLSDVLAEVPGFNQIEQRNGQGTPILRGMLARQILVLVDGVKINNSLWRVNSTTKEQLNLIDLSQIERIEVVRGVVSVLGTESLGGVVNIITRKGPEGSANVGGSLHARYASADKSFSTPLDAWVRAGSLTLHAGGTYAKLGDLRGGGNVGTQGFSGYSQNAVHLNAEYALTKERTFTAAYQTMAIDDMQFWESLVPGSSVKYNQYDIIPAKMRMASFSYQDLSSRSWSDALKTTAYWNVQDDGTTRITAAKPNSREDAVNSLEMMGFNAEVGKFFGAHHLLYGFDLGSEKVHSYIHTTDAVTGNMVATRGRYTDGASYRSASVYVNDRFNVTKWATIGAGIRHGRFVTKGSEIVPYFGAMDLGATQSDTTGALNLTVHAAPGLNLIAGAFRGFRAPSLDDMSKYFLLGNRTTVEIPNPTMTPERILSFEGGAKYESSKLSGSLFYFRNKLTDVIVRSPSTFNGLNFIDNNGNGRKDSGEPAILQNRNVGKATVDGFELEFTFAPVSSILVTGNFTKTAGTDEATGLVMPYIQPQSGVATVRYTLPVVRAPWAELTARYASSSKSTDGNATVINPNNIESTPGFRVYTLRAGMALNRNFIVTAALENLTDEKYGPFRYPTLTSFTPLYGPGRQLVLGTTFNF